MYCINVYFVSRITPILNLNLTRYTQVVISCRSSSARRTNVNSVVFCLVILSSKVRRPQKRPSEILKREILKVVTHSLSTSATITSEDNVTGRSIAAKRTGEEAKSGESSEKSYCDIPRVNADIAIEIKFVPSASGALEWRTEQEQREK
ncbi:hypothetical protein PUN28_008636 [Cardiocondyla obscurior]|uniref:Uncharacterized protein n=1 Tax=Cardiocondyla obscurior TaxID=286306 RepID=A0AAW2G4S9_9HYME